MASRVPNEVPTEADGSNESCSLVGRASQGEGHRGSEPHLHRGHGEEGEAGVRADATSDRHAGSAAGTPDREDRRRDAGRSVRGDAERARSVRPREGSCGSEEGPREGPFLVRLSRTLPPALPPLPSLETEKPRYQGFSLSGRRGSNSRPSAWEAIRVPLWVSLAAWLSHFSQGMRRL